MFSLESWKSFTIFKAEKYVAFFELEIFRLLVVKSQGLDSNADPYSPKSLDLDLGLGISDKKIIPRKTE
jgi:hypothetical protein